MLPDPSDTQTNPERVLLLHLDLMSSTAVTISAVLLLPNCDGGELAMDRDQYIHFNSCDMNVLIKRLVLINVAQQ